jgi:prepilin-type N-terminal cleavage/methylation domain-containing protein
VRRKAFTLVELLVVMALLVAFGALLLRFVAGALELWRRSETTRELGEKATAVFEMLGRDLRAIHPVRVHESPEPNRARFLAEFATLDRNGDRLPETVTRRLRLLRALDPAEEAAALASGPGRPPTKVAAEGEMRAPPDRAGDGFAEVAWATAPDAAAADPAVLSLYRGARPASLDPKGSFFRDGFFGAPRTFVDDLHEVIGGVLEFAPLFPRSGTQGWREIVPDRPGPAAVASWDSTRGRALDPGVHPGNRFPLEKGEVSAANPRDDVVPARVLVTLVLERQGPGRRMSKLVRAVGPADLALEIDDPRGLPRVFPFLAKIEGEWVEVTRVSGRAVTLGRRAARDTVPTPHAAGALLHTGETFRTEYALPAAREDWNG